MAYSRYATEMKDGDNNIYGLMDEEARAQLSDLNSALNFDEYLINAGQYTIKATDLESGQWSYSTKAANTARARTKFLIPVRAGMVITYSNTTFDTYFNVLETPTSQAYITDIGWKTDGNGIIPINVDGYLTLVIRNHSDTSATVNPSDYNSTVTIITKQKKDVTDSFTATNNEIADIKMMITGNGIAVLKHAGLTGDPLTPYSTNTRVLIDFKKYGKVLKCTLKLGYQCLIYNQESTSTYMPTIITENSDYTFFLNAYSGTNWAFVIRKENNTEAITFEEAFDAFTIEDVNHNVEEVANGLYKETVEFIPNQLFFTDGMKYGYALDRATSAPIKIPKGGIRITHNPETVQSGTSVQFRVVCVKMTSNGFQLITQEENEDLYAESIILTGTTEPVYIPYIENAYIIINTASFSNTPSRLVNAIWVYSGEINQKGKLLGLHPMRVYITNGVPSIQWGNQNAIVNTTNYYGGFLWLKYAKKIIVSPKYSIVANIYKLNANGTVTLMDSYWTYDFQPQGSPAGRVSGVQYIDLTQYEFDGFVYFAIQCPVMYRTRAPIEHSYKTPIGMGVMSKYMDVYSNVFVEYYNYYQETVEQGLPSVLFESINDYTNYTYPLRLQSNYVLPSWAGNADNHLFTPTEDAAPAFYAGYNGNTIFLNVTGKSYYTAMGNINSRCYQYKWTIGSDVIRNIGYGTSCTDFTCMLLGLKENHFTTDFIFGADINKKVQKFTRVKSGWDYTHDMDMLKPGDVLSELVLKKKTVSGTEVWYQEGHCMIVYEKRYVNSQLESITLIEAGYPYTRFTTLYNQKYKPLTGSWQGFERLADYQYVNRIKPEYLKRFKDVFDVSTSYTNGTIMCDRGTDSIYCVNPVDGAYPDGVKELDAAKLLLTITDNTASSVRIYKDGTLIDTVSITGETMDIHNKITSGGLYTLKTNNSDDVQERFYVMEIDTDAMAFETDDVEGSNRRIHIPDYADLRWMEVEYTVGANEENFRITYVPEDFDPDESEYAKGAGWGVVTIPENVTVPADLYHGKTQLPYDYVVLIYGTEYGTYQVRYISRNGTVIPCAYSGLSLKG